MSKEISSVSENGLIERCSRCRAVFGSDDRFCSVCGAAREEAAPVVKPRQRRGFRLLLGAALLVVLVCGAVAYLYFSAPERQKPVVIAHLSNIPGGLAILPADRPLVFASSPNQLLASADKGSHWDPLPIDGVTAVVAASATAPPTVYVAGSQLWRGDGFTLAPITTTLPTQAVHALAVDPTNSNRVFALVAGQGILGSNDGGQSWRLVSANPPSDTTSLTATGRSPGLFVGTADHGVFASADGSSWGNANGFVNGALPTHTISAIAFDPRSGDRFVGPSGASSEGALYVATDQGLFKSIDDGSSWTKLSFRDPAVALAATGDGSHFLLTIDPQGNVYRSSDGGVSWR
jgi:hypothetical protein